VTRRPGRRARATTGAACAAAIAAALGGSATAPAPSPAQPTPAPAPSPAPGDWTTFGFDSSRTADNQAETLLGPANAGSLRLSWSHDLGALAETQPLVVTGVMVAGLRRDLVIAGTEGGLLVAVDAGTGQVVWQRDLGHQLTGCPDLPGSTYGVTSTPVVDRRAGIVYSAGGDDRLYALDLATGAPRPGWPVGIGAVRAREHIWSALALSGPLLYAVTASYCEQGYYRGKVVAVDTRRARRVSTFYPLGAHSHARGGGVWGWGGAVVDPRTGNLYVGTANAQIPRQGYGLAEHLLQLSPHLRLQASNRPPLPPGDDADFGAAPVLLQPPGCPPQLAVVNKTGLLLLYDRDSIAAGPRQSLQIASPQALSLFGTVAYSPPAQMLFVATASDAPATFHHGLQAFAVTGCRLALRWQTAAGAPQEPPSPPVVANGVVYLATGETPGLTAFDASTGRKLWSSGTLITLPVFGAPTVSGGRLYATSWDHHLYAFALPASEG